MQTWMIVCGIFVILIVVMFVMVAREERRSQNWLFKRGVIV